MGRRTQTAGRSHPRLIQQQHTHLVKLCCHIVLWLCLTGLAASDARGSGLPPPRIPSDNPLTVAKAALGEQLFNDTRLSIDQTYSCASCHQPDRHFTDGLPRAINMYGEQLRFNTPTLYNVAYNSSYGWTDQGVLSLEAQHSGPLFNTTPVEMGFSAASLAQLQADDTYPQLFEAAFGERRINSDLITRALASYVRSIRHPASAFDDLLFNDNRNALSADANAGMDLFFSAELGCSHCHAALTFSGPISHALVQTAPAFHVTGVSGSTTAFRAPTLRAIAHTAPYMHDGSLQSLAQVLNFYQHSAAENVPEFSLTDQQTKQLIAFLKTL
ncbi:MAG: cytochrome-c peroxidase [bacterium]